MTKVSYDTSIFPFKQAIEELFKVGDLALLNDQVEVFKRENDQSTVYHKAFYEWARTNSFEKLYDRFILEVVKPLYAEQIVYQAIPTFRIAYPNNIAV